MASQHKHIDVRPPGMAEVPGMQEHFPAKKKAAKKRLFDITDGTAVTKDEILFLHEQYQPAPLLYLCIPDGNRLTHGQLQE